MRNGQLTRVLALWRCLCAERRTVDSWARDFSVTTRTVRRDLAALQDAGLPLRKSGDCDEEVYQRLWWVAR